MEDVITSLFRTLIVFLVLLMMFRFMGKKELGEISLLDIIVSIMIAELAVVSIEDPSVSMVTALAPIFLLILLQMLLGTIGLKSQFFRKVVEGTPVIIIENGTLIQKNLKKHRYTLEDIIFQLRQAGIADLREVDYAILERSGTLSIFKKNDDHSQFTVPLILDGIVQENNLKIVKKTKEWLISELKKKGYTDINHIFYCSYMNDQFYIVMKEYGA